jgi:DNA polymerase III subunit gamma/tau
MGQALYRSYRSKKLSEIVGQEHITQALDHALAHGTISHAYLFTGPRGVGKTSIARILAHEINGLPYDNNERPHLDIIEIDAASNRRIDEIRDLRDKVHIAPASATYKVYIIDEVHMLTREAFNALLKTLEEPPAHAVFILATTEVHKLPETIISRTQRYAFKPVEQQKVVAHLRSIATAEGIAITDEALTLIAAHGEGSFRDSISLLDQVRNRGGTVELADVQALLGIAPAEHITTVLTALDAHQALTVAETLQTMQQQGYEPAQIAKQLSEAIRQQVLQGANGLPHQTAIKLLSALLHVPASSDPGVALQIAVLDAALADVAPTPTQPKAATRSPQPTKAPAQVAHETVTKPVVEASAKPLAPAVTIAASVAAVPAPQPIQPPKAAADSGSTDISDDLLLDDNIWHAVLEGLKKESASIYHAARLAQPHYAPGTITLELSKAFHKKFLSDIKNQQVIGRIMRGVIGKEVGITVILGQGKPAPQAGSENALPPATGEIVHNADAKPQPASIIDPLAGSNPIAAISNIFGGAEVLES